MATPGHTPEHLAWLVRAGDRGAPAGGVQRGSLLVGSAGRTDLQGPGRMTGLSFDEYASLQRLAQLPDDVQVLPTHGAGSFCVAGTSDAERTSTIGRERQDNPYLSVPDADGFRQFMAPRLGRFPGYYPHVAGLIARVRRRATGSMAPRPRTPDELARVVREGAIVVDARDRWTFGDLHIPGSINVEPTGTRSGRGSPPSCLSERRSCWSPIRAPRATCATWRSSSGASGSSPWSATSRVASPHGKKAVGPSWATTS